jgi:hypothetical protein
MLGAMSADGRENVLGAPLALPRRALAAEPLLAFGLGDHRDVRVVAQTCSASADRDDDCAAPGGTIFISTFGGPLMVAVGGAGQPAGAEKR